MAHSRLEKIGTIYTRVSGLIKAGAMKLEDRPLWYEVYQAFPPRYPPQYSRPYPDDPVKPIFYPEDIIRAKFYKVMRNAPLMNLSDTAHQTLSQKCIEICTKLQNDSNLTLDEAFERALSTIRENVDFKSSQTVKELNDVIEHKREHANITKKDPINVKELFDS